ncbi:DUF4435 domain-containing protein [Yersinia enterocolitica]|uniref:DUF4435 domain-containing protein n=1 Tax=Yersinia TaxID=629 RepID=UPI0005DEB1E3|nr:MULTISPECIES: DUF4435 domain-containing protein [Yersinia]EKN5160671.1 DUF4435 domain-containing protein [Yersinia enterocolitica]EKN6072325.1 DUF4435 domain-containing protein [Yersinia enterocolitica]EKN6193337.1 DUF4435 domain-containing protein [Yersinia enterocolitica]EKN6374332.1 DUF4435 domain-containing protein [Yersinia enterocolitica]ELI8126797.1 DUF4435 domain-containing protein [Yersinia enterocolitica]
MTFTRTASGLKSYRHFYDAEIIVYIEGRLAGKDGTENIDEQKIFDVIFYTSLFKILSPYKKVKIKIVGCKENVLDYHDNIQRENINNSYAIIDRDYDGILFSRVNADKLIVTHGYSWENDFWSPKLCSETIEAISLDSNTAHTIISKKYNRSIKRLCIINRANIISHYFCNGIFPVSKKGGDKGFRYEVSSNFPLSLQEIKRLLAKVPKDAKGDDNIKKLITATEINYRNLIQGHFYEYMSLQILSHAYKISSGIDHNMADFSMIKSIAFNKFKLKPDYYLKPDTLQHYELQFQKILN